MRIAVIGHPWTEAENRARWVEFARQFPDVETTVISPARWSSVWFGKPTETLVKEEVAGNYRVLPVPVRRSGDNIFFHYQGLSSTLRSLRPDVIHVFAEPFSLSCFQALVTCTLCCPQARRLFFTWNNINLKPRHPLILLFEQVAYRLAHAAVAGSQEGRQVLNLRGFEKPIMVQTELGVDPTRWAPGDEPELRSELALQGMVIGFAGRLRTEKGILDLVEAVLGLTGDWTLLMIGDGALRPDIEARFQAAGLSERFHCTGEIPRQQLPRYYRAMDVLVLPSHTTPTWKEQFGLVMAEAMLSGVPVIGSDSGAIPEVIGDAGIVFPEGDVGSLRSALSSLQDNRQRSALIGRRGRSRAMDRFTTLVLSCEIHGFYEDLLGAKGTM